MWAKILRVFLFGALALILSLVLAPGEAQAHGAHAAMGSFEQATSRDATDGEAATAKSVLKPFDCVTCCPSAGCMAIAFVMTPAIPEYDNPRCTYAISTVVSAYHATRQGLRRPPKLDI